MTGHSPGLFTHSEVCGVPGSLRLPRRIWAFITSAFMPESLGKRSSQKALFLVATIKDLCFFS